MKPVITRNYMCAHVHSGYSEMTWRWQGSRAGKIASWMGRKELNVRKANALVRSPTVGLQLRRAFEKRVPGKGMTYVRTPRVM